MSEFTTTDKTVTPPISLLECISPQHNKTFRDTINIFHSYVKYKDSPTRNIRWLVYETVSGNLVGAVGLSSATISVKLRDTYVSWNNETKMRHLGKLANNSRFCLIRKNFTLKNVGSMTLKRLRVDGATRWFTKYGDPLILLETFVQPDRHELLDGQTTRNGAIYLADNWINVGLTNGSSIRKSPLGLWKREKGSRGKLARENPTECLKQHSSYLGDANSSGYKVTISPKKIILLKPLILNWQSLLLS